VFICATDGLPVDILQSLQRVRMSVYVGHCYHCVAFLTLSWLSFAYNAVVTCEIKLFQNYFGLHRCPDWNNFA